MSTNLRRKLDTLLAAALVVTVWIVVPIEDRDTGSLSFRSSPNDGRERRTNKATVGHVPSAIELTGIQLTTVSDQLSQRHNVCSLLDQTLNDKRTSTSRKLFIRRE